jgi:hypothetical protein
MSRSPPLRFLILLLAGWSGMRAALLMPGWWAMRADAGGLPERAVAASRPERPAQSERAAMPTEIRPIIGAGAVRVPRTRPRQAPFPKPAEIAVAADRAPWTGLEWALVPSAAARQPPLRRSGPAAAALAVPDAPHWSVSAWSFLRPGETVPLAAGGMLGGSQAGARIAYRLNRDRARPLALAARATSPLRRSAGAEAALGLDWQPSRRLPGHVLAERRQRLGGDGRSAFGLTLYGGVSDAPLGRLRVEAYAQAGIVGARSHDLFGDGALRLSLPFGRVRLGAGAWAAAQPGTARLDLGPQASLRLPLAGRSVSVAADWRQRVAGEARPGSGPTLTLATDF